MAYCKFCKKDVTPTVKTYETDGEFAVEYFCPTCGALIEEKRYPKRRSLRSRLRCMGHLLRRRAVLSSIGRTRWGCLED